MHGLCLLLFPGTVPEFVTPLFPSQATQHPWFSRLPSFHAPAFPPPPNIRIFYLIPCSVFSSRLPWQAHSRKRKPLPPQSPILTGRVWSCPSTQLPQREQYRVTTSTFSQVPTASQSYGGISRGMKEGTAQHSINFPNPGQSMEVLQLPNQRQIIELFIHFLWAHFPKENPPQDTSAVCGWWDPLLWQQKDTGGSWAREFPGAKTKP